MKLICIDDKPRYHTRCNNGRPFLLKYGNIYTISNDDSDVYNLVETDAVNPTYQYKKDRFIPLSDIDEKEFNRNYIKEPV